MTARKSSEVERLEREIALLRQVEEARRKGPGDFPLGGCAAKSCIIRPPRGMGTSGRCHCEEGALRRAMLWWRRRAEFLEQTIQEMRDAHVAAEVQWNREMVEMLERREGSTKPGA